VRATAIHRLRASHDQIQIDPDPSGQHIVQPQPAKIVSVKRGIQRRVATMRCLHPAMTAARRRVLQPGMRQKGRYPFAQSVAICGVKIAVAQKDERRLRAQPSAAHRPEQPPEGGLVMVALPLRSSGPSKTGGVACQAKRCSGPSPVITGTSQNPVVARR
jgi:hypothetical protein